MTAAEMREILNPLMLTYGQPIDQAVWTMYWKALQDVSPVLLRGAVEMAAKVDTAFVPKPGELRAMAEQHRKALMAATKYERCESCNYTGWIEAVDERGYRRAQRCACWAAYQNQLESIGAGGPSLEPSRPKFLGEAI